MFYRNGIIAEYIINEQRTNSTGLPYHNSIDEMKWDVNSEYSVFDRFNLSHNRAMYSIFLYRKRTGQGGHGSVNFIVTPLL